MLELALDIMYHGLDGLLHVRRDVATHSARHHQPKEVAMPAKLGIQPQEAFFEDLELRLSHCQTGCLAEIGLIPQVVVEPLQFGKERTEKARAPGNLDFSDLLDSSKVLAGLSTGMRPASARITRNRAVASSQCAGLRRYAGAIKA